MRSKIGVVSWCCLCIILGYHMPPVGATIVADTVCGRASELLGNCFNNFTSSVAAEALHKVAIPGSLEEINQRCAIFTRGMDCVRQYQCVNARQRKIIENEVYGAQQLYQYLCYDHSFQREFLRHKSCFGLVHPEWEGCSNQFMHVLKEEMARTGRQSMDVQYMHFCCARYAYESCVYRSARYICKPDSAVFLRRIAKLLSTDRHFENCDRIENALCSDAGPTVAASNAYAPLVGLSMLAMLFVH